MEIEIDTIGQAVYRLLDFQLLQHDDGTILKRGTVRVFIEGTGFEQAMSALVSAATSSKGIRINDVLQKLPTEQQPVLLQLVDALKQRRFLVPFDTEASETDSAQAVFYWNYGTTATAVGNSLAQVDLAIVGVNSISMAMISELRKSRFEEIIIVDHPLFRNLSMFDDETQQLLPEYGESADFNIVSFDDWSDEDSFPECLIVCSDFGGLSLMREWNEFCVKESILFFPVVLQDHQAYLGPIVIPGQSPCFECAWSRQNSNLTNPLTERATEAASYFGQHCVGFLPPMATVAASFATMELIKYFSRALPGGNIGKMIEIDMLEPAVIGRKFLKAPRCPVCSGLSTRSTPATDSTVFMPGND